MSRGRLVGRDRLREGHQRAADRAGFALLGAIISDVDPFRAELLGRMWADAIPPAELADAAVLLWCRIRAGGASRDDALTAVRGPLADPDSHRSGQR